MTESLPNDRLQDFDENYKRIREAIALAAQKAGRQAEEITLLAATKTVPVELVNYGIQQGLTAVGENRVQELLEKVDALDLRHCQLHFIGQLQTNKIKYLVDRVSCIQSVDNVKQVKEISRLCLAKQKTMDILVEVNIGREPQKAGVLPEALFEFLDEIHTIQGVHVRGFMTVPPVCDDKKKLIMYFSAMQQYYVDIKGKKIDNISMDCLSMGMSSDFEEAIACGATTVRIGSSLFGKRSRM